MSTYRHVALPKFLLVFLYMLILSADTVLYLILLFFGPLSTPRPSFPGSISPSGRLNPRGLPSDGFDIAGGRVGLSPGLALLLGYVLSFMELELVRDDDTTLRQRYPITILFCHVEVKMAIQMEIQMERWSLRWRQAALAILYEWMRRKNEKQ